MSIMSRQIHNDPMVTPRARHTQVSCGASLQPALGLGLRRPHLRRPLRDLQGLGRRRGLRCGPRATAGAAGIRLVGFQEFDDFLGGKYEKDEKIVEALQGSTEKSREEKAKVGTGCLYSLATGGESFFRGGSLNLEFMQGKWTYTKPLEMHAGPTP